VKDGYLTITGERKPVETKEMSVLVRSEIPRGKFRRSIELPHPVELNGVTAELANGILRMVLPKSPEARPREIAVK
jgi:HSP20 family protein